MEAIQTILDVIKNSGQVKKILLSIRKKILLSDVTSKYKFLARFLEDTDSHLFGKELEDSLEKAKGNHYTVCRHSNLRQNTLILRPSENPMNFQKRSIPSHKDTLHRATSQVHGRNWKNNPSAEEANTKITTNMGETEET